MSFNLESGYDAMIKFVIGCFGGCIIKTIINTTGAPPFHLILILPTITTILAAIFSRKISILFGIFIGYLLIGQHIP